MSRPHGSEEFREKNVNSTLHGAPRKHRETERIITIYQLWSMDRQSHQPGFTTRWDLVYMTDATLHTYIARITYQSSKFGRQQYIKSRWSTVTNLDPSPDYRYAAQSQRPSLAWPDSEKQIKQDSGEHGSWQQGLLAHDGVETEALPLQVQNQVGSFFERAKEII